MYWFGYTHVCINTHMYVCQTYTHVWYVYMVRVYGTCMVRVWYVYGTCMVRVWYVYDVLAQWVRGSVVMWS